MRINRNDSPAANGAPQAQPTPATQEAKPQKPEPKKEAAPAKEKPKKKAEKEAYVAEEEETEHTKRRFPFGCLIVLIVLALVAFGGYKIFQFYGEIDGSNELGEEQTVTIEQGSSVGTIAT